AGVHCEQQFFHVDFEGAFSEESFMKRTNAFLPPDISILSINKVKEGAHARFDATQRRYVYRICRHKNPFLRDLSYQFYLPLDVEKMNRASALLLLHKDFQCFSKAKSDTRTYFCDITSAEWVWENDLLVFYVRANRFLRGMVRAIVGT